MSKQQSKAGFFDAQYAEMTGDEAEALDHRWYRYLLPFATTRVSVAVAMLDGRRFGDVVELGVGDGELVAGKLASFDRYLGFDISEYQLARVPETVRNDPRVRLQQADLDGRLRCDEASADLVVSLSTIEYLRDPVAFLREINRILRPDATLLLQTMNLAFLPRRLQLLAGKLPTFNAAAGWQGGILHQFTFPTMTALLRDSGFAVEDVRCAGLAPRFRLWWRNALASDMLFRCRKVRSV